MDESDPTIEETNKAIAEFNKRFEQTSPAPDIVTEPWLSNEAAAGLPQLRHDFDQSRDPVTAERDGEAESASQSGKAPEQPKLELRPPRQSAPSPGSSSHSEGWLTAERDSAMSNTPASITNKDRTQEHTQAFKGPERER